jgi:hypothetical protein
MNMPRLKADMLYVLMQSANQGDPLAPIKAAFF